MKKPVPETDFDYVPHPHISARKALRSKMADAVIAGKIRPTLNDRLGLGITKRVGTMWAAYAFFAISLIALPMVISRGDTVEIIGWVTQTLLQLVLLPIILVGQNMQSRASEKRAVLTYEDAAAVLDEAMKIQKHLEQQDKVLGHLIERIEELDAKLKKK